MAEEITTSNVCAVASGQTGFPCDVNAITGVSLGIAGAACALIFVNFFLLPQVSQSMTQRYGCPNSHSLSFSGLYDALCVILSLTLYLLLLLTRSTPF